MRDLPNDVIDHPVSVTIGPFEAQLEVHSFEHEWTTVLHKPDLVHVRGRLRSTEPQPRNETIGTSIKLTLTVKQWERLNRQARTGAGHGD